jgi:hypothetical protein
MSDAIFLILIAIDGAAGVAPYTPLPNAYALIFADAVVIAISM